MWYWYKDRHLDQWNRKESLESHTCMVNWFSTRLPIPFNGEKTVSLRNDGELTQYLYVKEDEIGPLPYTIHKN